MTPKNIKENEIEKEIKFLEHIKQMLFSQDTVRKSDSRPTIRTIQERLEELKKMIEQI